MPYNQLIQEQENLTSQIEALQKKISLLPEGKLLCTRNGNYVKWFKSNGKNPIYIPKKNRSLAEALALKKYYQLQLNELTIRLHSLNSSLQSRSNTKTDYLSLLDEASCYKELLEAHFCSFSDELNKWVKEDFERNSMHPEHLKHKTFANCMVRSKSEAIIANTLFSNKIPFRYECALWLQNICFYPDFTIRHPKTGETVYWEHFGMMDNPAYSDKAFNKLSQYARQGIIPTINLITTYETQSSPINSSTIRNIVHEHFL